MQYSRIFILIAGHISFEADNGVVIKHISFNEYVKHVFLDDQLLQFRISREKFSKTGYL